MKVWVDCTAAAHPLVLRPVIERLKARGHDVFITAREFGQTVGVLRRLGLEHTVVERHGGASTPGKALALAARSARLLPLVRRQRPDFGLGHGSVDLAVVAALLRFPSIQMQDYEFAGLQRQISFRAARRILVPDAIPLERLARVGANGRKVFRYPGLKEEYYLADFQPDRTVLDSLGLDGAPVLAVVRPPPETSEYHRPNELHEQVLRHLGEAEGVVVVVIPRTVRQAEAVHSLGRPNLVVAWAAIDAQSLIAFADLVVSAGGTMNREAAALGTPAYTSFVGRMGGVDERLVAEGRLRVLEDPGQLELRKRGDPPGLQQRRDPELIVEGVLGGVG